MPFHSQSLLDTQNIILSFIPSIKKTDTIFLYGSLGSGKTTISRIIIQTLTQTKDFIQSPTFSLIQQYEGSQWNIWHADLYRIVQKEEIFDLNLMEIQRHALVLIEWPEILKNLIKPTIAITITHPSHGRIEERIIQIESCK